MYLNHRFFEIGKTKRTSPVNHFVPFRINCPLQKKPSISSSVEFEVVEMNAFRQIPCGSLLAHLKICTRIYCISQQDYLVISILRKWLTHSLLITSAWILAKLRNLQRICTNAARVWYSENPRVLALLLPHKPAKSIANITMLTH